MFREGGFKLETSKFVFVVEVRKKDTYGNKVNVKRIKNKMKKDLLSYFDLESLQYSNRYI